MQGGESYFPLTGGRARDKVVHPLPDPARVGPHLEQLGEPKAMYGTGLHQWVYSRNICDSLSRITVAFKATGD